MEWIYKQIAIIIFVCFNQMFIQLAFKRFGIYTSTCT